jgi:hypothetical protein
MTPLLKVLFDLGQCIATHGALDAIIQNNQTPIEFLARHGAGDWGALDAHDTAANDAALIPNSAGECARILSAYHLRDHTKIWTITEGDRSLTTILLPDEY